MQAIFRHPGYIPRMAGSKKNTLQTLREQAGFSQRELARQLDVHPSNIAFWEGDEKKPSSHVLLKLADLLGVSVEEILGAEPRKSQVARGRLGKLFAEASKLPRSQQDRIAIILEDMLAAQKAKAS